MMATECTQEAVLEFLIDQGGRVRNKELLAHFKVFLGSDNPRRTQLKESFKRFVDNIAYVKQQDGEKFVILKKKYRDPDVRSDQLEGEGYNGQELEFASIHNEPGAAKDQTNGVSYSEINANGFNKGACSIDPNLANDTRLGRDAKSWSEENRVEADGRRSACDLQESDLCISDITLLEVSNVAHVKEQTGNVSAKVPKANGVAMEEDVSNCGNQDSGRDGAPHVVRRRRPSRGSQRSLKDEGEAEPDCATPKGVRRHAPRAGSSPGRRPLVRRSSQGQMMGGRRRDSVKSEGDLSSVAEDDCATATLDPLEHEWMMCASDGEWESLRRLLESEPGLIGKKDFVTGFTCLHWAAKQGKHELLAMLVTYARQHSVTVNVNARSSAGYTPLHLAAMHRHVEVMKLLVGAYDADLEVRDYSGRKPSHYLDASMARDIRDIIGACEDPERENVEGGAGRWRLTKVLQSNLKPLRLLSLAEEAAGVGDGQARPKSLYRKSSVGRIKLNRSKFKSQIVHSTSFRETEEGVEVLKSPSKSRPISNLFG